MRKASSLLVMAVVAWIGPAGAVTGPHEIAQRSEFTHDVVIPTETPLYQGMSEATGAASFTLPFALPANRGRVQPRLRLGYSGGYGIAEGWTHGVPCVEYDGNYGTPDTHDQPRWVVNGRPLVPGPAMDGVDREVEYRTDPDTHVRYWLSDDGKYWQSATLEGTGQQFERLNGKWCLSYEVDMNQNHVHYDWDVVNGQGILQAIRYLPTDGADAVQIEFEYEYEPEFRVSYKTGTAVAVDHAKISRVVVLDHFGTAQMEALFDYEDEVHTRRPTGATVVAGGEATKRYAFEYNSIEGPQGAEAELYETVMDRSRFYGVRDTSGGDTMYGHRQDIALFDATGDGLKDIVRACDGPFGEYTIVPGTNASALSLQPIFDEANPLHISPPVYNYTEPCVFSLGEPLSGGSRTVHTIVLTDWDGDGLSDRVFKDDYGLWVQRTLPSADGTGLFADMFQVALPSGAPEFLQEDFRGVYGHWKVADLIDMNGDRRPDLVVAGENALHPAGYLDVFINRGDRLDSAKRHYLPSDHAPLCSSLDGVVGAGCVEAGVNYETWQLRDINGDGLPDILSVNPEKATGLHVWLNRGESFGALTLAWSMAGSVPTSLSMDDATNTGSACSGANYRTADLLDMNGDGLVDYVWKAGNEIRWARNTGSGFAEPDVWILSGGVARLVSTDAEVEWDISYSDPDYECTRTVTGTLVDLDGDRVLDYMENRDPYTYVKVSAALSNYGDTVATPEGSLSFVETPFSRSVMEYTTAVSTGDVALRLSSWSYQAPIRIDGLGKTRQRVPVTPLMRVLRTPNHGNTEEFYYRYGPGHYDEERRTFGNFESVQRFERLGRRAVTTTYALDGPMRSLKTSEIHDAAESGVTVDKVFEYEPAVAAYSNTEFAALMLESEFGGRARTLYEYDDFGSRTLACNEELDGGAWIGLGCRAWDWAYAHGLAFSFRAVSEEREPSENPFSNAVTRYYYDGLALGALQVPPGSAPYGVVTKKEQLHEFVSMHPLQRTWWTETYEYDTYGQLTDVWRGSSRLAHYERTSATLYRDVALEVDAVGNEMRYRYREPYGYVTAEVGPGIPGATLSPEKTYTLDAWGRVTQSYRAYTVNFLGLPRFERTHTFAYFDSTGDEPAKIQVWYTPGGSHVTSQPKRILWHDGNGRALLVRDLDWVKGEVRDVWYRWYMGVGTDLAHQLSEPTVSPMPFSPLVYVPAPPTVLWRESFLDGEGRLVRQRDFSGTQRAAIEYLDHGLLTRRVDGEGRVLETTRNVLGHPIRLSSSRGSEGCHKTYIRRDYQGRPTAVAQGACNTADANLERPVMEYEYYTDGLLKNVRRPEPGGTTVLTRNFQYDQSGAVVRMVTGRGCTVENGVDLLGRVTSTHYENCKDDGSVDAPDVVYTYEDPTDPFSANRLTAVSGWDGGLQLWSKEYDFTMRGLVGHEVHTVGGLATELWYGYDARGLPTQITVAGLMDGTLVRDYDSFERERDLYWRDSAGTLTTLVSPVDYDRWGQVGSAGPLTQTFDADGVLERRVYGDALGTWLDETAQRYADGRLSLVSSFNPFYGTTDTTYGYDFRGRLVSAVEDGASSFAAQYGYKPSNYTGIPDTSSISDGSRYAERDLGAVGYRVSGSRLDQDGYATSPDLYLQNGWNYDLDGNANTISVQSWGTGRATTRIEYDADNLARRVWTDDGHEIRVLYDEGRKPIQTIEDGDVRTQVGPVFVDSTGAAHMKIGVAGMEFGTVDESGAMIWELTSLLGSTAGRYNVLTKKWSAASENVEPFGVMISANMGPFGTAFKGKFQAQRSGLPYVVNGERLYDAEVGSFLSIDPELLIGGIDRFLSPWLADPYAFAGGDPVSYHDPDGRQAQAVLEVDIQQVWEAIRALGPAAGALAVAGAPVLYIAVGLAAPVVDAVVNGPQHASLGPVHDKVFAKQAVEKEFAEARAASSETSQQGQSATGSATPPEDPERNGGESRRTSSPNQMNKAIDRGKAPDGIKRVDVGKVRGEQVHVHFDDGSAMNVDGTWKHGSGDLTTAQAKWLRANGWTTPTQ